MSAPNTLLNAGRSAENVPQGYIRIGEHRHHARVTNWHDVVDCKS